MRLGTIAKAKIRHTVGILRTLQTLQRDLYDRGKEKRNHLGKLKALRDDALHKLRDFDASARFYTAGEGLQQERARFSQRVDEAEERVAAVRDELERLDAERSALEPDLRAARSFAEKIMLRVDADETLLREELDFYPPGVYPPPPPDPRRA